MATKTNVEYLRHILDALGNLMGADNYRESIEWLDAIQNELDDKNKEIRGLKDDLAECEEGNRGHDSEISELKDQLSRYDYENTIDTGMGSKEQLRWSCHNFAIQSLMETFGDKLKKNGHAKIENLLNALS